VLSARTVTNANISELTVEDVYAKFTSDLSRSERANNILDFEFDDDSICGLTDQASSQTISAQYHPMHTFFNCFQENGGIVRLFAVAIQCVQNLTNEKMREGFTLWLNELESFSKIPLYFNHFMQNKKSQELLFSALLSGKDTPIN